jgi:hypothetical protein
MLNLSEFSLNHHPSGVKRLKNKSDVEFRFSALLSLEVT